MTINHRIIASAAAKWTAILIFAITTYNTASPKAFAQSSNRVIHLLCKGGMFKSGGRLDIDLDKREMAGYLERTNCSADGKQCNTYKMIVTNESYTMRADSSNGITGFLISIDRITGHLVWRR
jgi:hypothetical protein